MRTDLLQRGIGGLVPKPGEGPSRENMEAGWLRVHGRASCDDGTYLESTYFVDEDTGYLGTAKMLVACATVSFLTPSTRRWLS